MPPPSSAAPCRRRRLLLVAAAPAALAACGFQLRQAPEFAFDSIFVAMPNNSALGTELRRQIAASGKVRVVPDARQIDTAQVVLDSLVDQREKVVVGLNAAGQVTEFQLRLRFRFRLRSRADGRVLIPDTELLQQRDISFSESAVLAKEAEEQLLYRNMQTDIVQQIMRRLAAVRQV